VSKTKYSGVYKDKNGKYFFQAELGVDLVTGKRIQKKGRKNQFGKPFENAQEAFQELVRLKNEFFELKGYRNYNMTYGQFMREIYIPYYESDVEWSTWNSREGTLRKISKRFEAKKLRDITVEDCEMFRIFLLTKSGYSQGYASLVYGMFRKSLDYAVLMQYLDVNISKRTKAISKGKSIVPYWTKEEFEKVISTFYLENFYEHMSFVMLWLYYVTGIRVSEGTALTWNDVDFRKKKLRVHHTLEMKNQANYRRKPYTKTDSGRRMLSLDDDTIDILKKWKKIQAKHGVENFVFSYTDLPLGRSTVHHIIVRHAKLAGVHSVQGKGLRHSHVSYLINEFNASVLIVSKRLGHSSPDITLKHYAHLWSRGDEEIAEMISGNISIKTSPKNLVKFAGNQAVKFR
jgi:integrase